MPKYTTEQIRAELYWLEDSRPLISYYLELELERRSRAGRPCTGQAMTGAERVARYRAKNKLKKGVDK